DGDGSGQRRRSHGDGERRRGRRRAGEHGRLGLEDGGGLVPNGDDGRRQIGGRGRVPEDAFERARARQAQRGPRERRRAAALTGPDGEDDRGRLGRIGLGRRGRGGQLAAAARTEPGPINGRLALFAIHAFSPSRGLAAAFTLLAAGSGRKLFATCRRGRIR